MGGRASAGRTPGRTLGPCTRVCSRDQGGVRITNVDLFGQVVLCHPHRHCRQSPRMSWCGGGGGGGEGCETLLSPEPKPWQRGQGQTRPGDRDWGLAAHMPLSGPAPPGKPLTPMGPECGARGGGSIEDMGQGQPLEPPPPPQGWAAPAAPLGSVSGVRALATGCTPVTLHSRGPSLRSRSNGTVPRAALPPLHKHLVCLRTYRPGSTFGF